MSEIPIYSKQDCAFNSLNKEFRNTRFQNSPMNIRIHNPKYSGNGMKGIYEHDTSNVNNLGGAVFLTRGASLNRKSKEPKVIELDSLAVKEKDQIEHNGAMLKGNMITSKKDAEKWIKFNKQKYSRGKHRISGHWSGGMLRREYEANTVLSEQILNEDDDDDDDEFKMLSDKINEQESSDLIKRGV